MIRDFIAKVRAAVALAYRIRTEPVLLVGLALVVLGAYQEAAAGGLGGEDLLLYVAEMALAWFARELVIPTAKIEGSANYVPRPVEKPYIPGPLGE